MSATISFISPSYSSVSAASTSVIWGWTASIITLTPASAVPAVVGVAAGKRLRSSVGERQRRTAVLVLLTVIGVRLVASGIGVA